MPRPNGRGRAPRLLKGLGSVRSNASTCLHRDNIAHIPCTVVNTVAPAILVSRDMLIMLHTIGCIAVSRKQDDHAHIDF